MAPAEPPAAAAVEDAAAAGAPPLPTGFRDDEAGTAGRSSSDSDSESVVGPAISEKRRDRWRRSRGGVEVEKEEKENNVGKNQLIRRLPISFRPSKLTRPEMIRSILF